MHQAMAAAHRRDRRPRSRRIQDDARAGGSTERPRWPMIVLRTPKGWTGPNEVDGLPVEGTFRAHQVPLAELAENPEHLRALEAWMRALPARGALRRARPAAAGASRRSRPRASAAWAPTRTPTAGLLLRDLRLPDFRDYAVDVPEPGDPSSEATRVLGGWLREVDARNAETLPRLRARRDRVQPARRRLRGDRPRLDGRAAARRRAPRPRRPRDGGALASICARAGWRATC